ncbi:Glycerol kinase [Sphaceloma murrayae]|uniref:glycerol kinase n=1 Tax=Sphaceloma murrayae TaxID=2082308 RepID=A0A2K1QRB9_9PEZI|nr:Glycerol kinase [Sphaceloma murrayae]
MASEEVFVGSIDQGTTSSRFLIFNKQGEPVAVHQEEFKQIFPNPGWHEHDPEEIISSVNTCIDKAVEQFTSAGHKIDSIKAVGITNQRETTVVWDRKTGKALYNAIVWTDTRTAQIVHELKARPGSDKLMDICGEPLSTYPSVTKLIWLLKNVPEVKEVYERGDLSFGTIDTWLIYKLNGGASKNVFVSDPTNASRTMFLDIHTLKYSEHMRDFFSYEFDFSKISFPKIVRSADKESFGELAEGALKGFKITGCLGDQSAALVGQKGFEAGTAKNTYGTGCFLLYNCGKDPVISKNGLLSTVAYDFGPEHGTLYALEGSIAVAGSGVKFLVDNLGFGIESKKITELAGTVPNNGGLVFVTAFSGLFAPYWIDDAQGTMFGITQHTQPAHIARATLEAVCFQTKAILDAMAKDSSQPLASLRVDGGMSNSELTMQTQADVTGIPIIRPKMRETTALGAAIAAGLAVGVWKGLKELEEVNKDGETVFERKIDEKEAGKMFGKWERAVEMTRGWVVDE